MLNHHAEMEVIAAGKSRQTGVPDISPPLNFFTALHIRTAQMGVHAEQPEAVIDDNGSAVDTDVADKGNLAAVGRRDRGMGSGSQVHPQVHLGVDLAATAHSPVPAANRGKVAFVGNIGIYGRTVIIDHGFGLFSMYSHLSSADVQSGEEVQRGGNIGNTGLTGLAGGDHLHFGMMIQHTFVDPIEWWDAAWIKNNITDKISSIKSTLGVE